MKKLITVCTVIVMILAVSNAVQATSLSMDITGVIKTPGPANVGDWMQVGPIGPNDDLDMYGRTMTGEIDTIVSETCTITSSGMGEIYCAGIYRLEEFTWTTTTVFRCDWESGTIADVAGTLTAEVSICQLGVWPEPAVDWSTANLGTLPGTFNSSAKTLIATVALEPATIVFPRSWRFNQ